MIRARVLRNGFAALALALLPSLGRADQAAADAAFDKGQLKQAIALYDEILARDPKNAHALLRSGRALIWRNQFLSAVERYQRLIDSAPSGEGGSADPNVLAAIDGKAEALSRIGASYQSRRLYERALALEPSRRQSEVGLGWLDVWADPPSAVSRLRRLEQRFPGDADVKALKDVSSKQWSPWLGVSYGRQSDSADSSAERTALEGRFHLRNGAQLRFEAAHHLLEAPGRADAKTDSLLGYAELGAGAGRRVLLSAGLDNQESSTGQTRTAWLGSAGFSIGSGRRARATVRASHDVVRYNPELLDKRIDIDSITGNLDVNLTRFLSLESELGYGHVDSVVGSMNRVNGRAALTHRFLLGGRVPFDVGYALSYLDHDRDPHSGYWAPADLVNHAALARFAVFLPSGLGVAAQVTYGIQDYTDRSSGVAHDVNGDRSLSMYAVASLPLPLPGGAFALEGLYNRSEGSLQNPTGFNISSYGVRLAWREKR